MRGLQFAFKKIADSGQVKAGQYWQASSEGQVSLWASSPNILTSFPCFVLASFSHAFAFSFYVCL